MTPGQDDARNKQAAKAIRQMRKFAREEKKKTAVTKKTKKGEKKKKERLLPGQEGEGRADWNY
jgi:hypothetical protein